jgi:hypothetical protein
MNGRIYDPLLGRFLSADLVVQFPGNLQSYNRYSYVENNPLTRFDPTGWYSVMGLEFIDGGGVKGFFKDLGDYGGDVVMGAVGDNMVEGYKSGTEHMTNGMSEIANAQGGLDATIGGLHMVAGVAAAVGVVLEIVPGGKAEKVAAEGAEKLAVKAESAVTRAVEKAEGKAATIEKRVEGVAAGADSTVSKAAPATEAKGGVPKPDGGYTADISKSEAKSRSGQSNAANKQLNEDMKANPKLRAEQEAKHGPDVVDRTSTSNGGRRNPQGAEWDHNSTDKNKLDLRTKENHAEKTRVEGKKGGGWKRFWGDD